MRAVKRHRGVIGERLIDVRVAIVIDPVTALWSTRVTLRVLVIAIKAEAVGAFTITIAVFV